MHDHKHSQLPDHNHQRVSEAAHVTVLGLFVNILLTTFKLIAGVAGRSSAMLADGAHSLSDFATDLVVLWGFRLIAKPADKEHQYGHGKIETLITAVIGLALFFAGIRIFWSGLTSIAGALQGTYLHKPGWIAFYAAICSILTKEFLYRFTLKTGEKIDSQAVIANAWHHRSDALSSFGALLGISGAILFGEKWRILDPAAAVIVSFFIIRVAFSICFHSINELVEASVDDEMKEQILELINSVSGVRNPHKMRTRRIGNDIAIDIHIEVDRSLNIVQAHDISSRVEEILKRELGRNTFVYVHVEPFFDSRDNKG